MLVVVFFMIHQATTIFAEVVPPDLYSEWCAAGSRNPICEAKLYPVYSSLLVWFRLVERRRVILFIDNTASKDALIKGRSTTAVGQLMVQAILELVCNAQCIIWYARVPSASNPADDPSRGRSNELRNLGAVQIQPRHMHSFISSAEEARRQAQTPRTMQ